MHTRAVDTEPYKRALFLPALMAGRARIDVKHTVLFVVHHPEDVRVAVNHQIDVIVNKKACYPGRVSPGITAYVSHHYIDILNSEYFYLLAEASHLTVVDIATHRPHHRRNFAQPLQSGDVADIACVPYFVTALEVRRETVVPAGVGVREDAYQFHFVQKLVRIKI